VGTIVYAAGRQAGDVGAELRVLKGQVDGLQKQVDQLHAEINARKAP
jgi:hypothetical protein